VYEYVVLICVYTYEYHYGYTFELICVYGHTFI